MPSTNSSGSADTPDFEVVPPNTPFPNPMRLPALNMPSGFAWGFISGALAMAVAVYVIRKHI